MYILHFLTRRLTELEKGGTRVSMLSGSAKGRLSRFIRARYAALSAETKLLERFASRAVDRRQRDAMS